MYFFVVVENRHLGHIRHMVNLVRYLKMPPVEMSLSLERTLILAQLMAVNEPVGIVVEKMPIALDFEEVADWHIFEQAYAVVLVEVVPVVSGSVLDAETGVVEDAVEDNPILAVACVVDLEVPSLLVCCDF